MVRIQKPHLADCTDPPSRFEAGQRLDPNPNERSLRRARHKEQFSQIRERPAAAGPPEASAAGTNSVDSTRSPQKAKTVYKAPTACGSGQPAVMGSVIGRIAARTRCDGIHLRQRLIGAGTVRVTTRPAGSLVMLTIC